MPVEHINKMVWCKRAVFTNYGGTLEQLLLPLAGQLPSLRERQIMPESELDQAEDAPRTWLHRLRVLALDEGLHVLYGSLVRVSRGSYLPAIEGSLDSQEVELRALQSMLPPGVEMSDGYSIFAVFGNTIIVMPGGALTAGHVGWYLNEFLAKVRVTVPGQALSLEDRVPRHLRSGYEGVRRIRVGLPIASSIAEEEQPLRERHWLRDATAAVVSALRADFAFNGAGPEAFDRASAWIELRLQGRMGHGDASPLDGLVSGIPDDLAHSVHLEVAGVGTIKADACKIHRRMSIRHDDRLANDADAVKKFTQYYRALVQQGRIQPDDNQFAVG